LTKIDFLSLLQNIPTENILKRYQSKEDVVRHIRYRDRFYGATIQCLNTTGRGRRTRVVVVVVVVVVIVAVVRGRIEKCSEIGRTGTQNHFVRIDVLTVDCKNHIVKMRIIETQRKGH
jgi:hypothetical protein